MQITEIRQKKYCKNVFLVYVDNNFFAQLLDETIVKFHIESGKEVTQEFLENVKAEGNPPLALFTALNLLEKYTKTTRDLETYLLQKGFDKKTTEIVIEKLKNNRLLDDKKFAERFVENHKTKGKKALKFELKMKGIDESTINEVLSKIENQDEIILNLAKKFAKNKANDKKLKEKLFRHLANKGFDFDDINKAISKITKGNDFNDENWN